MARNDPVRSAWSRAFKGIYNRHDLRALASVGRLEATRQRRRRGGQLVRGRRGQSAG